MVLMIAACTTAERSTDTAGTMSLDSTGSRLPPVVDQRPTGSVDSVRIFYVLTEETTARTAEVGEKIGCGDRALAVTVDAQGTKAPLRFALERLLSSHTLRPAGPDAYNALYQTDLHIDSIGVSSVGDSAVIGLSGKFSYGGVCDAPRIEAQLMKTATQFPTIRHVAFFINGRPLREMLSEK